MKCTDGVTKLLQSQRPFISFLCYYPLVGYRHTTTTEPEAVSGGPTWLAKYSCEKVCMKSTGKYWIPVFNILGKTCFVTLVHPKYTRPPKENKTDQKDAKWICDLFWNIVLLMKLRF